MPTGGHIELPAMPRAGDDAPVQFPLSKWAARVRTDAVQCEELVANMKQRDDAATDDELTSLANWDVRS